MKKWVAVALAVALLITVPSNMQKVSAAEKESGKDLTTEATKGAAVGTAAVNGFVIENGVVTDYVGTATNITVPNGVTSIGMYAFMGCDITNVTLPNGVLTIGEGAFGECYNLTTINIPNTVTSIGQSAFFDCYELKSLSLPSSVNSIGEDAFGMCLGMESLFFYNKSATISGIYNKPADTNDGVSYYASVPIFPSSCTVYCYQNSAVHAAAISWNQPYVLLDNIDVSVPIVSYQTHIQNVGWQDYKVNGATSGTSGQGLRLEGIKIKVAGNESLGIQYTTHVQDYGWMPWSANDEMSGTSGESKRLEAIKIQLTGTDKDKYDVYYRVHAQDFGWLGWAKNGQAAGTAGYGKRLEAIEIKVVAKNGTAPGATANPYVANGGTDQAAGDTTVNVGYQTHVQNVGWQGLKYNGDMSGTSGQGLRLEGIKINLNNKPYSGSVAYSTHVQSIGWQDFVSNGDMSGTSGRSLRLEAIKIQLSGAMADHYDIYYRVHAQDYGWLGWAKNGEESGTAGLSKRLEGIEIVLVEKGGAAPGSTTNHYVTN